MKMIGLKLINNEDIIAEVESESEIEFVILNPVSIVVVPKAGQPSLDFAPFPMYAELKKGDTIVISKRNVVYSYPPTENFVTGYNQIFGSGLVVPPPKQIITG
jgi:hypothetical protein